MATYTIATASTHADGPGQPTSGDRSASVLAAQVGTLYGSSLYTSAGSMVTALAFWVAYYFYTRDRMVLVWAALLHTAQILRLGNNLAYRRSATAHADPEHWRQRYLWTLGVTGAAWGIAPFLLLPTDDLTRVSLMMLVLLGMGSGGIAAIVVDRQAVFTWLLPLLLPLPVALLLHAGPLHQALALFGAVYLGVNIAFALTQHRMVMRALNAQFDNADLVEQLRRQKDLADQANRDKSRFLAAASHDLRQPMHALGLFASALDKRLANTPEKPLITNLNRCIESLDRSFNAMLDVSRLDAGVVEPAVQSFPIRDVFRRLHMHFAGQAEALGLHLRFKPGGKFVASDPQLLEQILSNLIQNAIKYTREGGVVVVARNAGRGVHIEVWDTGIGIPEHELPRVFEEFYQLDNPERDRSRGMGMGLAIVRRLAMLLGHPMMVRSRPGRGTLFRLWVPRTDLDALHGMNLEAETIPGPLGDTRTLLIIDDEEQVRESTRALLTHWGYEVIVAASAAEACRAAVNHHDVIHAVISDLRLRSGEDGLKAIDMVRQALGHPLPAVLVTGDTSPERVRHLHESGHRVLFKPVRPKELYAVLRQLT